MKKVLILLCAMLLLYGCAKEENTSTPTTVPQTEPTGAYIADHAIENTTDGAVRAYDIGGELMAIVSDGIAVWGNNGLSVYDTQEGRILYQTASVSNILAMKDTKIYYEDGGICAYDYLTGKTQQWELPQDIQGQYAIGYDTQEIYYCISGAVYSLNMETGISRVLKTHSAQEQTITGAYFGGSLIGWQTEEGISYLSTVDGSLRSTEQGIRVLYTQGQSYLAQRQDGMVEQVIVGTQEGEHQLLQLSGEFLLPALQMNAVLQISDDMTISHFDMTTGKKTAQLTIPEAKNAKAITAADGFVWILTADTLYRWEVAKSPVEDETVYTGTLYTAQNPDSEGIALCQTRVEQMNEKYGVRIQIAADAVAQPGDHALLMEHQPVAIESMLDQLEPLLQHFPEGFLRSTVAKGWVQICLVRQVNGEPGYARYWVDGDCYIVIALGANMEEAFLCALGGGIDSHILGNSRDLEYWSRSNPKGFAYIGDDAMPEEYAQYIGTHFVDELAMTYPNEDRARLFYYAMTEGNEDLFAQPAMQQKLKMLCEGIREAYDLKKHTEVFLWEQYLSESLAYTN